MSLYVDSSALLKRYADEPDSELSDSILRSDPPLVTARHTIIEVRRNLSAAQRVGGPAVTFLTFDARQGQAARTLGVHRRRRVRMGGPRYRQIASVLPTAGSPRAGTSV